MSSLHFDPFQFAGRRSLPVHAEYTQDGWTSNGISYEDFGRMSSIPSSVSLRHRRWTPAFAASDEKLRRVLLYRARRYVHAKPGITPDLDWKTINAAATKKTIEGYPAFFQNCPAHKQCESVAHVVAVKHAGGYLELQAALAYHAWRLGQDSIAIAEALHMSPQSVRVNLQRLCDVARSLGYETFARHYSYHRPRAKAKRSATKKNDPWIIALYKAGKTVSEIAQAIGYPRGHGNNRVRHVLLKAGIYKGRGERQTSV